MWGSRQQGARRRCREVSGEDLLQVVGAAQPVAVHKVRGLILAFGGDKQVDPRMPSNLLMPCSSIGPVCNKAQSIGPVCAQSVGCDQASACHAKGQHG